MQRNLCILYSEMYTKRAIRPSIIIGRASGYPSGYRRWRSSTAIPRTVIFILIIFQRLTVHLRQKLFIAQVAIWCAACARGGTKPLPDAGMTRSRQ